MFRSVPLLVFLAASASAQTDADPKSPSQLQARIEWSAGSSVATPPATLIFDVEFRHEVMNKTDEPLENVRVYVPVPADCYEQKVTDLVWLREGQPTKVSFEKDQYGQRVAAFVWPKLSAHGRMVVGFRCRAALRKPDRVKLPAVPVAGLAAGLARIPEAIRRTYAKDIPRVYDLGSELIREKATELTGDCQDLAARVAAIYDFVAEELTYKRDGGWDPASDVLRRKSGSCSEFSYVFSSLCRANGIPTRFVGASMFRPKKVRQYPYVDKVWHRWIQVYLPDIGWVHMDPTRDRGKSAKHEFFGRQPGPALVLSQHGGRSKYLGNHYVSADNQSSKQVKRVRRFLWTPVTAKPQANQR